MDGQHERTVDILVADDSLDDLRLIVNILSREGYAVRPVINGEAALAGIRARPPDLLLLDIKMPKINGFEVCRHLTSEKSPIAVPIIFVSASNSIEDKVKAFAAGAVDYIAKPYQAGEVTARVRTHLSLSFMKKELQSNNGLLAKEIAERRRIEDELIHSQTQLRSLSTHLHTSIEKERARIAREIHDDLGQALTILNMDLAWLAKKVTTNQPLLIEKINSMSALTLNAVQSVKMICADLRPGILDDFGIAAAIEWQAEEFEKRTKVNTCVTIEPSDFTLDEKRTTALFRIFQEALTNILRHARASLVEVNLRKTSRDVVLQVKDNGIGIPQLVLSQSTSLGLLGIQERVHALDGNTEIKHATDQGTIIRVSIPI